MVIAALVVFGALLAAWLLAPAEPARVSPMVDQRANEVSATLTEGLAEAA
jgi:hypothetical protein